MFSVLSRGRDSGIWIEGPEVATAPPNPADESESTQNESASSQQPVVNPSPAVASCGPVTTRGPVATRGPLANPGPMANRGPVANSGPVANHALAANSGPVASFGSGAIHGPSVDTLTNMGFPRLDAEQALRQTNNDVNRAASLLIRR